MFVGGMKGADIDAHLTDARSYVYALNGRIKFNRSDGADSVEDAQSSSKTGSFVNEKGTKLAFTFCDGYEPVGSCDYDGGTILFLSNGTNSEIGILTANNVTETVTYKTLFNDRLDPNGDKLNFSLSNPIEAQVLIESPTQTRLYVADGKNQDLAINLALLYDGQNAIYHTNQTCGATNNYPYWLSVHGFLQQADVVFGTLKFLRQIEDTGSLLSGTYRYFYRYVTRNGYKTPFSPITNKFFLTTRKISQLNGNHHNYEMVESGIDTNKSVELRLVGLDSRFYKVELGYIYQVSDDTVTEVKVFEGRLLSQGATEFAFIHNNNGGYDILEEELTARLQSIYSSETLSVKENRLYKMNLDMVPNISADVSAMSVFPFMRNMLSDNTLEPTFTAQTNPLTNSAPVNSTVSVQRFSGVSESHSIVNDFANYKGMQWANLFTGYRRGDTVTLAVVLFDRKGRPTFASEEIRYTIPPFYSTEQNMVFSELVGGRWNLRICGLKINGIRIPKEKLYGPDGKLNVSGFSVVRKEINSDVLHQGIITNTIRLATDKTYPDPFISNRFTPEYFKEGEGSHLYQIHPTRLNGNPCNNSPLVEPPNMVGQFMYYSPDVMVEQALDANKETDYVEAIGSCHKAYTNSRIELVGNNRHYYAKAYKTLRLAGDTNRGRPALGSQSRVKFSVLNSKFNATIEKFNIDDPNMKFYPENHLRFEGRNVDSLHNNYAPLLGLQDFESADVIENTTSTCSYYIVNYKRPRTEAKANPDNLAEQPSVYIPTGHFQPITQAILNQAVNAPSYYEFNDVEVWGGDTYLNWFDFVKNYPFYSRGCNDCDGPYHDYAASLIVPNESKYNLAMRLGRSFARYSTRPERTGCANDNVQFTKGVNTFQPEEWNINKCLVQKEAIAFYPSRPKDFEDIPAQPNAVVWSNAKIFGEEEDAFLKFLPNNIRILNGIHGEGVALRTMGDTLYFFQRRAYGIMFTSDREVIPTTGGGQLTIGTGAALAQIQYINTEHGCQERSSIVVKGRAIYWVDGTMSHLCRHSQAGYDSISNLHNANAFANFLLPSYNNPNDDVRVASGVNFDSDEVLFSFRHNTDTSKTVAIVFSEKIGAFSSFYSGVTQLFLKSGRHLFSANPSAPKELHHHFKGKRGEFYGKFYPSELSFVVNQSMNIEKVFDNLLINVNQSGSTRLNTTTLTTETQLQEIYLQTDPRVKFRDGQLRFPTREYEMGAPRLRGHWLLVKLSIENQDQIQDGLDLEVAVTSADTEFRVLQRA
jgi:hypothetical protein